MRVAVRLFSGMEKIEQRTELVAELDTLGMDCDNVHHSTVTYL